jgi:hypothetical protein
VKRKMIVFLGLVFPASLPGQANPVPIGVLSFDVFTPSANGSAGVNAFNISDFTGAFDLPPDFSASTALTLMDATLMADYGGGPPQVISLGNIGPGPLLDPNGHPLLVLQVPSTTNFTSASFMATLTPTSELRRYLRAFKEASCEFGRYSFGR